MPANLGEHAHHDLVLAAVGFEDGFGLGDHLRFHGLGTLKGCAIGQPSCAHNHIAIDVGHVNLSNAAAEQEPHRGNHDSERNAHAEVAVADSGAHKWHVAALNKALKDAREGLLPCGDPSKDARAFALLHMGQVRGKNQQ